MKRLHGKTAIVTGAGQGIGRAAAELFAAEGAQVLALDRNGAALAGLSGCTPHVIDLTDRAAIAAFGAQAGGVDVLFNCAGYVDAGTLLNTTDAGYALSFDLNVHAITHMLQALLPAMIARGGGSIINMASVAGPVIGVGNRYAYCASKAAVAGSPALWRLIMSGRAFAATRSARVRCNRLRWTSDWPPLATRPPRAPRSWRASRWGGSAPRGSRRTGALSGVG
jgi:NAD(P)-dependent dehydrogenase (short-subunit alcohol dehydrogenase family)